MTGVGPSSMRKLSFVLLVILKSKRKKRKKKKHIKWNRTESNCLDIPFLFFPFLVVLFRPLPFTASALAALSYRTTFALLSIHSRIHHRCRYRQRRESLQSFRERGSAIISLADTFHFRTSSAFGERRCKGSITIFFGPSFSPSERKKKKKKKKQCTF